MNLPANDPFLLFVYGTLMRDGANHALLAGQRFLGPARTRPGYALFNFGDHPGMVASARDGMAVHGELYEVARSRIPTLDELEEAPTQFRLEPVEVEGAAGPVYAYFYQQDPRDLALCEGGRWRNRTDAQGDGP
jgi:gamma-glutamylaminecyclotransferase